MTRYISHTDTNKMIRKALKEAFAGVKFSVRISGGSTWIEWTDGPARDQVEAISKKFEGCSFDGMTDYESYNTSTINGERVSFGASYIFTRRNLSDAFIEAKAAEYEALDTEAKCALFNTLANQHTSEPRAYANIASAVAAKPSPTADAIRFLKAA